MPNNSIFKHRREFFNKINLKVGPSFKNYDLKRKDLIPDGYDFIECEVESNNMILVPNGSR